MQRIYSQSSWNALKMTRASIYELRAVSAQTREIIAQSRRILEQSQPLRSGLSVETPEIAEAEQDQSKLPS
jgi:hypothetical protein